MDALANVYALDAQGALYKAAWAASSPSFTKIAASYTPPNGATLSPNGLTASLEGSVLVSMAITTTGPTVTTNYLFGLTLDTKNFYQNSGPPTTTSGTAAVYTGLSSCDFLYFNVVLNTDHNVYSMDVLRINHLAWPYV